MAPQNASVLTYLFTPYGERYRQSLNNNLPASVHALYDEIRAGTGAGWELVLNPSETIYHQNGQGNPELKFKNADGREAVFDGDTGKLIADGPYAGTYNFGGNKVSHTLLDIVPSPEVEDYYNQRGQAQALSDLAKNLGVTDFINNVSGALSDGKKYWSQPNNYLNPANNTDAALMEAIKNGESLADIYSKYKTILGNVKTFGPAAAFLIEELEGVNSVIKNVNKKFQELQGGVINNLLDAEYAIFQSNDKNSIKTMVGDLSGNSITGFSDGLGDASYLIDKVFAGKAIFNKANSAYGAITNLKTKIVQSVNQLKGDRVLAEINTGKLLEKMNYLAERSLTEENYVDGPWGEVPELLKTIAEGNDPKFATFGFGELGNALKKLKLASNGDDAKYYQDALGLIMTLKSAYDSSRALIKLTDELIKVGANLTVADISQADKNKLIIQALVIEKIKADNPDNWQELLSGQQVYATADNRSFSHDELIIASYSPSKP